MTRFAVSRVSTADVDATMEDVFSILRQPGKIAALTPYLHSIEPSGDEHWVWKLVGVPYLGGIVSPHFTERMVFEEPRAIRFSHDPPPGESEMAGADGVYQLSPRADGAAGCTLHIDLTIAVHLPLPVLARPFITSSMNVVIDQMGRQFSRNIIAELSGRSR